MIILNIIHFGLSALVLVLSFFFAIRFIFVHDLHLVAWRGPVKRRIYISHKAFRMVVQSTGLICFMIFLATANQILTQIFGN